ncbi:hypothetical protein [Inhella sp.]|uniref:hypothetical protein n=1 Tax=Inhella sp. TaxID=1921806 RepID=UPI0035B2E52D
MVIKQVKHWMKLRASAALWKPIADWAGSRGGEFKLTDEGEGFAIDDPGQGLGALRIEWGQPQREYITGPELRLRWELKLPADLQVMLIERHLMDALERIVFEAYTDTLQTRVDTDTPEEMRWLVMFSKAEQWKSRVARSRFSASGVTQQLASLWVGGALGEALAVASQELVPAAHPFVMLTQRGNLYLRTLMPEAQLEPIRQFAQLAEVAAREAQQLQLRMGDAGAWPTTSSMAWNPSGAANPPSVLPDQTS